MVAFRQNLNVSPSFPQVNKIVSSIAIDKCHHLYIATLKEMTPAHRRISEYLTECQTKVWSGSWESICPSREWIAYNAKCSLSTVRDYINKYEGLLFKHKTERDPETGKHKSNLYDVNIYFVETIILLKFLSLWHKFENNKENILKDVSEDPYFLVKKTFQRQRLSTLKLPTVYAGKLPTINSYTQLHLDIVLKRSAGKDPPRQERPQEMEIFRGLPLSFGQKKKLSLDFSPISLRLAKEEFKWYKDQGNHVRDPGGYLYKAAQRHTLEQLRNRFYRTRV